MFSTLHWSGVTWIESVLILGGGGEHTTSFVVPHFPVIWHSRSKFPIKLDYLDENCPSNQANQLLDPPIKT